LCNYVVLNYTNFDDGSYLRPNDCHQRAIMQCLSQGRVSTEFWSTEGQGRLDVPHSSWWQSSGDRPSMTSPDGTAGTLEPAGDASAALYWFNSSNLSYDDPNRPDIGWRPVTETDRNGNVTRWQYLPDRMLLTDPRGRTTTFFRNGYITEIRKPGPGGSELVWK